MISYEEVSVLIEEEIRQSARRESNNKLEDLRNENEKLKKKIKRLENKIKNFNK